MGGEATAWANLTTGEKHHAAERALAVQARLAKWPVLAGLAGLLAVSRLVAAGSARPGPTAAELAELPRTVCDIGPGELCDRYNADLGARGAMWNRAGRWEATRQAFDWAANRGGGLDGLSKAQKLDRVADAPQLRHLSAAERTEWRRGMEAHWRIMDADGPYGRALRRAHGADWRGRAPRVVFLILVAAGPAVIVLLVVRDVVARARERDGAVDAALAETLAGDHGAKPGLQIRQRARTGSEGGGPPWCGCLAVAG